MTTTAIRSRPGVSWMLWAGLAVLLGVLAATLPVMVAGGSLFLVALILALLIEPALGIILMLSLAPLKTLIATESPIALPLDVGQISLGLVGFAWAVWRVIRQHHTPLPRTRLYLPLIGFMLAFSPSLFAAISPGAWLSEMIKWIEMLLLVLIVLDLEREHRWQWIVFGVVLAGGLQALIGLYEFRGGSGAPHLWILGYTRFRAFGTFGQPNPFSAFMGLTLPLALGLAWGYALHTWAQLRQCLDRNASLLQSDWLVPGFLAGMYAGFGLVLLGGLFASMGRGAWLGFGAAGTVMVFFAPPRRWQGFLLLALGGMMVAMLWLTGYIPVGIQARIDNALNEFVGFGDMRGVPISDENYAIVERLAHWQAAIGMANDHPFIGVGLGNFEAAYPDYGIPSWPRALGHAHNDYLNVLAETGIIGLSVYLVGWTAIFYWTLRALRQSDPVLRGLVLGLLGTWTHLAVHSVVDKLYVNNIFLHVGVMLGLLAVADHFHQRSTMDREYVIT